MRAGSLKHQIVIQRYTEAQNDYGEAIATWTDLLSTRASIRPLSAKDIFIGKSLINETTHKVFMRYQIDIKPNDRVLFGSRIFSITSVINSEERNITIELLCKETF